MMESLQTIYMTPTKMVTRKFRQSRKRTRQRSQWIQDQEVTKVSLLGTMDWLLLVAPFAFIIMSSLIIANGSCSHSKGISARDPVCVGGQLDVQAWLALVGVEFGALSVILPRVQRLLVSKYLTHQLVYNGLGLAKILNSQSTAPLKTQLVHGSNKVFLLRLPFFTAVVVFSIMYKWSFVKVARYTAYELPISSPPSPLGHGAVGKSTISNNLIDVLDPSNSHSSLLTIHAPPTNNTSSSPPTYTQIYGPSLNPETLSSTIQVSTGTLVYCTPSFYSRGNVTATSSTWRPPNLTTTSYGNGLRVTSEDGSLLDISSCNGTLNIMSGIFGQTGVTPHYTSSLTANISVCTGYISWSINNVFNYSAPTALTGPIMDQPNDIGCVHEHFDLDNWMSTPSTEFVLGLLQGLSWKNDDLAKKAMDIVLATIDHTSSISRLGNSTSFTSHDPEPPPACSLPTIPITHSHTPSTSTQTDPLHSKALILTGLSPHSGTAQTLLGTTLQALILLFSLLTIVLLCTPGLPLVTEWSAQWLGLVYGLSGRRIQECVEGTSAGGNWARGVGEEIVGSGGRGSAVGGLGGGKVGGGGEGVGNGKDEQGRERVRRRDDLAVWLASAGGDGAEGNPYLVLGMEKGRVRKGWGHV